MGCTPQGRILHLAREWESFSGFEFTRPPLPPLSSRGCGFKDERRRAEREWEGEKRGRKGEDHLLCSSFYLRRSTSLVRGSYDRATSDHLYLSAHEKWLVMGLDNAHRVASQHVSRTFALAFFHFSQQWFYWEKREMRLREALSLAPLPLL